MKALVSFLMIFSIMLGFIGVGRLCWDSKWAVILLFIYSLGALFTIGMVSVLHTGTGGPVLDKKERKKLYVMGGHLKNTPSFSKYV